MVRNTIRYRFLTVSLIELKSFRFSRKDFHRMEKTREPGLNETFCSWYELLESLLKGTFRSQFIDELLRSGDFTKALNALRFSMISNTFKTAKSKFSLATLVKNWDDRTRAEGFEVFHSWNHSDHTFSTDSIPVLLIDHFTRVGVEDKDERTCLALLLDVYFFHVLALCVMRSWDDDRPGVRFTQVTQLLQQLQGSEGSGHQFVEDAETLLMIAVSQFHPSDCSYDEMVERIWALDMKIRVRFSVISSAVLGGHLRWGSRAMYDRDVERMRSDNIGDYPWLLYSLTTLTEEYVRLKKDGSTKQDRREIVQGLLNGLTPDPWCFFQTPPPISLDAYQEKHKHLRDLLGEYGEDLVLEFAACRPARNTYSPLALHFNFPHNLMNAILMVCLSGGSVESTSLNNLLVATPNDSSRFDRSIELVEKLMVFAGNSGDRVGPGGAKLIIYDPKVGQACCSMVISTMKKYLIDE